jgi:hypothetical protein
MGKESVQIRKRIDEERGGLEAGWVEFLDHEPKLL